MQRKLFIYETANGKRPFEDWLRGLKDKKGRAMVRARLNRIELGNLGDCKNVSDGVYELRIKFGPGYRVYFGQERDVLVVLLCGGDKSSQRRDIDLAKQYWRNYQDGN